MAGLRGQFGRPIAESFKASNPARRSWQSTCMAGGIAGSVLLLTTPASVFKRAVPFLILLACALFALQPVATRVLAKRQAPSKQHRSLGLHLAVLLAAVYGAYFGAGLGIVLLAILGLAIPDSLQRLNGLKQVLSVVINSVALVAYSAFGRVAWTAVAVMAVASLAGGRLGGGFARRLSPIVSARSSPQLRRHGRLHTAGAAMTPAHPGWYARRACSLD